MVIAGLVGQTASRLGCAFVYDVAAFTVFRFLEAATSSAWFYAFFVLGMFCIAPTELRATLYIHYLAFFVFHTARRILYIIYILRPYGLITY